MTGRPVRTIELRSGEAIPVLGLGTWGFGEDPGRRAAEIATLRDGVAVGLTLIDTAELYGGGRSEEVVGEAIDGRRDDVFLVSKVLPSNATRTGTIAACERSLRRLGTDRLDLYLLHWRGKVPLRETLDAFADLREKGWIRYWGVCNFDVTQMAELRLFGGEDVTTDQVLYNLQHRGIEHDLLPWCLERGIPLMTYLPLEGGHILDHPTLKAVADRHGATPAQVALAWVLRHERLATIATTARPEHVRENLYALTLPLDLRDVAALDEAFPRPAGPRALDIH